ncbi:5'-AMP-activated protein kinase subunit gamma [Thalictrum thalictroides]|uniref:5'-AMP-activated protein kinase subunit gamma n=1 Tax=Thalictrum thalictroides TaxID=46969 RepID=A0A7J6X2M9_THATH|nr:5'-AMP-activated protein kinase subunit gamma [Thalictrum thalictroides]
MVTTRFSWPYGGRQVFLCGSFTGWIDHVLMTPIESSNMVFQAICNLSPGYHQYKFLVDGIWHVDEQQQCVTDEQGTVTNVIFVQELERVSPIVQSEASSSRSSMEVDNGIFEQPALFSGAMGSELAFQIPEDGIDFCRRQFSVLLSRYTAYELLPVSGKVSVLDVTVALKQAFHVMYEQSLAVVPIWDDCRSQFFGMLTPSDFILILTELHKNRSNLTDGELDAHSILAWKEGKYQLNRQSDRSVNPLHGRALIQAGPNESLKDIALRILQSKISMVPIIHQAQDSLSPQLLHLACLSDIWRDFRHSSRSLPLFQQPIGRLSIGTWVPNIGRAARCQLTSLQSDAPLSSALTMLMEAQVSSVPIVDDSGSLLNVYSRSDIMSLANCNAFAHIQLDKTSINQALQLRYEAYGGISSHTQSQTCFRSESLHEIMDRFSDQAVRRLIVIQPGSKRVEGIISLRDIFNYFMV